MELSKQQQKAVIHSGSPALVVAGAGSGKTRTLTAKILHLINTGHPPERILAITFTNKAADEMKSRLYKLTGMGYAQFPWVRTYHSACLVILKKHCELAGYTNPIQICSGYHQKKIATEVLVNSNLDKKHAGNLISAISRAKNSGDPLQYFDMRPRISSIPVKIYDLFTQYENKLIQANSVDFDNILLKTRDILRENNDVREYYKNYFTNILVDEYQDTNDLQDELTRLLLGEHGNLFCVGDDWQAVYGFRGSNVSHFIQFPRRYDNSKIFRLEENYRSADEIVQVANGLIDFNHDKMDKKCFSRKRGGTVEIHDFHSDADEAHWVTGKAKSLNAYGDGIPFDKMAVVYRTKFCSLAFEKTFRLFRIPYRLMGAQGFFERMEILDINSYLSASVFPNDDVSFERILNTPKRGIGPAMIKKIGAARSEGMSLQDSARIMVRERVLSKKIHDSISELLVILDDIREMTPDAAIGEIIQRTSYNEHLKKICKTEGELITKKENIEQLRFTAKEKFDILEYLEEAALIREDKETQDENDNSDEGVALLTIHSAKGLEFDTVFVVGCEENLFPHWRSIDSGEKALQEERRLMYVAMTRAERYLFLSHANYRKGQFSMRSRFIDQIEECISY
ncbi:PcrA1 [Desulfamplus magnetovallimortis]|uniref:DNA 3'-5' helicase n=1 Tax=Desulfamplus magnetovallimortis TaxID=1246637 RepID=A0A1W1HIH5_9BACT|nr:ATP-dependent helicase [Desulfamplus magnetovallimortis]SLM32301.1 PcrA1 [Desulfamplus magnetovallimortis]